MKEKDEKIDYWKCPTCGQQITAITMFSLCSDPGCRGCNKPIGDYFPVYFEEKK